MTAVETEIVLERLEVDWERHKGDKRPKILPPPGEVWRNPATNRKVGHRYYTRVTTYADAITEAYNLTAWKLRRVALGMGQRPDYVRLAASLTDHDRDRDALDELVGKALEAAGPNAADLGTALHSLTERLDRGEDLGNPPEEVLPDLAAYTAVTEGVVRYVHREARVVCDELECAGTPDGHAIIGEPPPAEGGPVCDCPPDRLRIIDTKTGSIRYPGKMSTQLAIYAHADLYVPATGERVPIDVCPHWGVIVHLPVETGEAALFWLDLEHGWRGAELCGPVRAWHKVKTDDILRPFSSVQPVKVVEGEVTRIEPRLASTNIKQPAAPTELTELTEVDLEVPSAPSPESEDAADLDGTDEPEVRRCDQLVNPIDPASATCERPAGHPGAHEGPAGPTPVERCEISGLVVGQCACGTCRPDLAGVGDDGVQPDDAPAELPPLSSMSEQIAAVARGDDPDAAEFDGAYLDALADAEELASGPDSDAEDEPERCGVSMRGGPNDGLPCDLPPGHNGGVHDRPPADPIAEAITRCVTTRDLELLSSTAWRTWGPEHRTLAGEVHARLEAAEAADRPRAAAEAAILNAGTLDELAAVMREIVGQPWASSDLLTLADAQWRQLKRDAAR